MADNPEAAETTVLDNRGVPNLVGKGAVEGAPTNVHVEELIHALRVALWVWDPDTPESVRMQQPATAEDVNGLTYKSTKIEYIGATENPLYLGKHADKDAATSDLNWYIKKFTYDGSNRVIDIQSDITSWDNRDAI